MNARWIEEIGAARPTVIDATVIARWLPGRFYRVSTISTEPQDTAERPFAAMISGAKPISDEETLPKFVTQVFHCDKMGMPDRFIPLFSLEAETEKDALARHREVVTLFSKCSLRDVKRFECEELRKNPALEFLLPE